MIVEAGAVAEPMAPRSREKGMGSRKTNAMTRKTSRVFSQAPQFEVFPDPEGDEGESYVGDEVHAVLHRFRDQIEDAGTDKDTG